MDRILGYLAMVYIFFALATDSCIGGSDTVCQHQWYGIVWMASWFGAWIVLPA